jgi:hypothetical protein
LGRQRSHAAVLAKGIAETASVLNYFSALKKLP